MRFKSNMKNFDVLVQGELKRPFPKMDTELLFIQALLQNVHLYRAIIVEFCLSDDGQRIIYSQSMIP